MDRSFSLHRAPFLSSFLPSSVKISRDPHDFNLMNSPSNRRSLRTGFTSTAFNDRKVPSVRASAGASHCDFSSLNAPLEPRSAPGKFLSGVLQYQRQVFHFAAADELKRLADDRDATVARVSVSSDSDESCLHRRIAQLKEQECQAAVEDVMYMLIFYKFSEYRVPLVPKLSRCIYNCRLEILPSKDWELESIHSVEVLEMVREHVSAVIGLRTNSSVTDNWATTDIQRPRLGRLYAASILYGYFLKSASSRHQLEQCLTLVHQKHLNDRNFLQFLDLLPCGIKSLVFGHAKDMQSVPFGQGSDRQEMNLKELRCYVMGFDPETLQRCAKLRSKEAANLIERHSCALIGDEQTDVTDVVIKTSFSSLKRLVLEAVAFGSFLWDIEEYVNTVYRLKDN
ncbi:putative chloroplast-targeted copper chaperone [Hibiscus syriacus]|uniref:Chloroplast-targeted copper chaperone n=1 Tax=Hibiscus syriacus TaxID=106335 RepID=A0A6A2ZK83_HIBSY|nr:UV-B-induced protein At3g17800, chloroplastic-like [Hibiscus syriacus]KAE8692133.1 putative chloroplast-targeted copper chaperone [Hibiscus syriacus]